MRLLIVGAGATGGYFGGRLAQAGRDVTFLVRPARAAALAANGLHIASPQGDAAIVPKLVTSQEIDAPYDAVLLTVKAYALESAMADLAPAIGPETMILPVLNGMRHVDTLTARFGAHAVAGCTAKIAAMLDAEGRIVHLAPMHELGYGEMDGSASPRIVELDGFMRNAGFDARLSPSIAREMWEKWILLAGLGGITCLMGGPIGAVVAAPGGRDFCLALLGEIIRTVTAAGIPPSPAFIAAATATLTAPGSPQTSSMFRDMQQGAPVEAEQILGDLIGRAAGVGIATPLLATAYARLAVYQAASIDKARSTG
jgi:2-dehydropantoate 2-reductase